MTQSFALIPPLPPSDSQICESPLTCDAAVTLICQYGASERLYHSRLVRNRLLLGGVLLKVRRFEFWREMGCASWMEFLKREFPRLSGLEERTAYDAIHLAESKTLTGLPLAELEAIPTLSHARHIARQERAGIAVDVAAVNGTPVRKLKEHNGVTALWMPDEEKTTQLKRVMDALAPASAPALQWLADLLESDAVRAYVGNSPNLPDFLLGVMTTCAWDEIHAAYADMCEQLGPERVAVLAAHGWRCVACALFLPLQAHHIEFRSQGGGDGPENLEPRCANCHGKVHGR